MTSRSGRLPNGGFNDLLTQESPTFQDYMEMLESMTKPLVLPSGLQELLDDQEFLIVFMPTQLEIAYLLDHYANYKNADKQLFTEALYVIRKFLKKE